MTLSIFIDRDCPPGMSKCGDGSSCNDNPWFCNGRPECADGSDEDADFAQTVSFSFVFLKIKVFGRLYVRVGILHKCGKYLHHHICSLREKA